jgi:acetate kinase
MKVLVINSGSSSLKYQLIETKTTEIMCKGGVERIGEGEFAILSHSGAGKSFRDEKYVCKTHTEAVTKMLELVIDKTYGALSTLKEIDAFGHRVVHGGEIFKTSTLATLANLKDVDALAELAPLHNPANVLGVRVCMEVLPGVPNVMVFDTAFHSTMPKSSYLYALPLSDYEKHKIRRYGFHGTSHNFVAREAAKMVGKRIEDLKIITCHIGNGASVAAIMGGKSVDTSMGMTPVEGLIMGTRCGDLDPAIVEVLCRVHKLSVAECINYLNKKSGLLGLSEYGNDMRDLMSVRGSNAKAQTAIDCFVHRLVKHIGSAAATMNGVDVIVWTGGIGNNDEVVRREVMKNFAFIGANIDVTKSDKLNGKDGGRNLTLDITASGSKVKTLVICTNEELEIALETEKICK